MCIPDRSYYIFRANLMCIPNGSIYSEASLMCIPKIELAYNPGRTHDMCGCRFASLAWKNIVVG